jgi:hypothetical protein
MRLASAGPPVNGRVPGERINLRPRRRSPYLASKNDLVLVPGMRFTAMATGHSTGLELGGNEGIFFNHHPGDIEFLCYRTSHQYSLDHNATIAHRRLKSSRLLTLVPQLQQRAHHSKKKLTTLNKYQYLFEASLSRAFPTSAAAFMNTF